MSNNKNQLLLINTSLLPKTTISIYPYESNSIKYVLGSYIIIHNLNTNQKKIYQTNISLLNKILLVECLNEFNFVIISLNNYLLPQLNIFCTNLNKDIYSIDIQMKNKIHITNIFIDKFRHNLYLILISSIEKNYLYYFHSNTNNNIYELNFIDELNLQSEIVEFKCFYNDNYAICLTRNSLIYYEVNLEKKNIISLFKNIKFNFVLSVRELSLSNFNHGLIGFISTKGDCLVFNKKGNKIKKISPVEKSDFFENCQFFDNFLCLQSANGNIIIDDLYDFKIKYYIEYSNIIQCLKRKYLINQNFDEENNLYQNKKVEVLYFREKENKIILKIENYCIILSSITDLINKYENNNTNKQQFFCLFNPCNAINNILFIYNINPTPNNKHDNVIYLFSETLIIEKYYDYNSNTINNNYMDLTKILQGTRSNHFITSMKISENNNFLFFGDNKGIIYAYQNNKYKKYYLNQKSPIISILQSIDYSLMYIGFENGMQVIYDINYDKNFKYFIQLTGNFLSNSEIDLRKQNNNIICYGYFFVTKKNCILYLSDKNEIKCSLIDEINEYNNSRIQVLFEIKYENLIIDIKMHKTEESIFVLTNNNRITINELTQGRILSIIDFNSILENIYNFEIDINGLYLSLICDFINKSKNTNRSDIIIIEIKSGLIKNYFKGIYPILKAKFDYNGRYIIACGLNGELFIWKNKSEINQKILDRINDNNNGEVLWEYYNIQHHGYNDITSLNKGNDNIIEEISKNENNDVIYQHVNSLCNKNIVEGNYNSEINFSKRHFNFNKNNFSMNLLTLKNDNRKSYRIINEKNKMFNNIKTNKKSHSMRPTNYINSYDISLNSKDFTNTSNFNPKNKFSSFRKYNSYYPNISLKKSNNFQNFHSQNTTIYKLLPSSNYEFDNIFNINPKIISDSSTLKNNERRINNISKAINNLKFKDRSSIDSSFSRRNSDLPNISKNLIVINNRKIKMNDSDVTFEEYNNKYKEPDDIDKDVDKEESDNYEKTVISEITYKENNSINDLENSKISNSRILDASRINNNNFFINNKKSKNVTQLFKENKNNENFLFKELENEQSSSIGDQISYLDENIENFEKRNTFNLK